MEPSTLNGLTSFRNGFSKRMASQALEEQDRFVSSLPGHNTSTKWTIKHRSGARSSPSWSKTPTSWVKWYKSMDWMLQCHVIPQLKIWPRSYLEGRSYHGPVRLTRSWIDSSDQFLNSSKSRDRKVQARQLLCMSTINHRISAHHKALLAFRKTRVCSVRHWRVPSTSRTLNLPSY